MLPTFTVHPEEHEIAVSATALLALDPRRLDQSQTTAGDRVPAAISL